MTRSIASLERRAAKRNLSVKEMKIIEVSRTKKPKIQESTVSLKPDNEPEGERWICDVCNNSNLTKRSKDLCNRCQRPRPILIPQCPPLAPSSSDQPVKTSEKTRVQPNSTNIKLSSRSPALQRQSLTQNSSQWKIEKPSEDQLFAKSKSSWTISWRRIAKGSIWNRHSKSQNSNWEKWKEET